MGGRSHLLPAPPCTSPVSTAVCRRVWASAFLISPFLNKMNPKVGTILCSWKRWGGPVWKLCFIRKTENIAEKLLRRFAMTRMLHIKTRLFSIIVPYLSQGDLSWHRNNTRNSACSVRRAATWMVTAFPLWLLSHGKRYQPWKLNECK